MSGLAATLLPALQRLPASEAIDDSGNYTTEHWLFPATAELIYGGLAALIVIALLIWKAGPAAKKAFQARTTRIETELDESADAKASAEAEAARVRQALGDIDSERRRILAEADQQADALLADGRARLDAEVAELQTKAEADIAAATSRTSDELRAEIARFAANAADEVVVRSLDEQAHQRLIEDYIQRVGTGVSS